MKLLVPGPSFLLPHPAPRTRGGGPGLHPLTSAPKDPRTGAHTHRLYNGTPVDKAMFAFLI